jgi:hypothetical protein
VTNYIGLCRIEYISTLAGIELDPNMEIHNVYALIASANVNSITILLRPRKFIGMMLETIIKR